MRLAHAVRDGVPEILVEHEGVLFEGPPEARGRDLDDLLADWDSWSEKLQSFVPKRVVEKLLPLSLPALLRPRKILAAGANYIDHMAEMGVPAPPEEATPFLFLKPSSSIIGSDAVVRTRMDEGTRLDYEAELGVVIGRRSRDLKPEDVAGAIAGYIVANDVSARGPFRVTAPLGPAFAFDWLAHKGQDGFCPMGPFFAPSWTVVAPENLAVRSWVNDELRQDSTTAQMLFSIQRLVAQASALTTLEPGDIVLTGTPAGVGAATGEFLQDGDRVRIEIESIGEVTTVFRKR